MGVVVDASGAGGGGGGVAACNFVPSVCNYQARTIEQFAYIPGVRYSYDDTGWTVTATSEASGVGNADASFVIAAFNPPTDPELELHRLCLGLEITLDSFLNPTIGPRLYFRVYVDQQDAPHLVVDNEIGAAGTHWDGGDIDSVTQAALLALLTDGNPHTFYLFMWVSHADNAIVSALVWAFGLGHTLTDFAVLTPQPGTIKLLFDGIADFLAMQPVADGQLFGAYRGVIPKAHWDYWDASVTGIPLTEKDMLGGSSLISDVGVALGRTTPNTHVRVKSGDWFMVSCVPHTLSVDGSPGFIDGIVINAEVF